MRREFSARIKAAAALRANGKCEAALIPHVLEPCNVKLTVGNIFYEHVDPDGLVGEPTLQNCACLCKACWRIKTRKYDIPQVAKAKRRERKHNGIRKANYRPLPGTRASGISKRMDGTVVRRDRT